MPLAVFSFSVKKNLGISSFTKLSEVTITLALLTLLCIHFVKKTNANVMFTVCGKLKVSTISIFFFFGGSFLCVFNHGREQGSKEVGQGGLLES